MALKILLPILVLGGFIFAGKHLLDTPPEQARRSAQALPPEVEVFTLIPRQYPLRLKTSGRIQAAVSSTLAAEVKGRITQLNPQFVVGGRVKKGEVLIEINDTDYQQSLVIVQAQLAQAQLAVEQGDAETDQVLRDRALLGLSGKPSKLALREPQRKSNQAALDAAKARVAQARTQLSRTKITAPFDGKITNTKVNIGQYVNVGTAVVELVGSEKLEVRLPLSDRQFAFIQSATLGKKPLPVTLNASQGLNANQGSPQQTWFAKLVRDEGLVDAQSLQQIAIAELSRADNGSKAPPALGLFVNAEIDAAVLQDVFVIPRSAIRNNNEIQIITADSTLRSQTLTPIWADAENVIIANKHQGEKKLVKRPMALAADGIKVIVINEAAE